MRNLVKVSIEGKMYLATSTETKLCNFMETCTGNLSGGLKGNLVAYLKAELKGTLKQMTLGDNTSTITTPLDEVELAALEQVENTLKRAEACALKYLTVLVFDTLLGEN